jgi:hypothetical protein
MQNFKILYLICTYLLNLSDLVQVIQQQQLNSLKT